MRLTEKQAIEIAQAIYGKQDERVKQIEQLYKNNQQDVIDMIASFVASDLAWNSNANPDDVATVLSNIKETFENVSKDDQSFIRTAFNGKKLNTNGNVLTAKITQEFVRQMLIQKVQITVSTEYIPDVVHSKNYKSAKKKINTYNRKTKRSISIDSILQRSARNAVLDRHVDSNMFSSINKQTLQIIRRVNEVAERAAKSPKDSLNWQKEVANILTGGSKSTNGQMGRAAGMVRTATAQTLNRTRLEQFKDDKVKKYKFISLEAPTTCQDCASLDGNIYNVADAEEGVNFPLMHYNCQCTVIEANSDNDWDTSDHDVSEELEKL
ncbi:Phage Mu protein F like protein [Companilactobacillus farciminis]|nr:Phage Mu protein F like protein [Companilactobacillus farciminis]